MTTPVEEVALRPNEAARRYNISKETIYREIREGRLKAHKPSPRLTLILLKDLDKWLKGRKVVGK